MGKRHVSLKDLAIELDVSISTVSRALKNHPDISKELKQKIKKLASERNYSPNPLAMGLLRQQTKMIGVIVPDMVTHFFASVISGIEDIAKQNGYYILIASSNESLKKEIESVENLLKSRVEGIIMCLSQETNHFEHLEKLIENEIPLVFFDRICTTLKVPSVTADGAEAAKNITRHFYNNGYNRIAYISGPEHLSISLNRKEGYVSGLKECGLPFIKDYLVQCNLSLNDATLASRKLLNLNNPPDAIFGLNDTIAFAAMKEIKKQGFRIPEDIGLIGFTDEFHSTVVEPTLTSVTHPTKEIGQKAAQLFFERLKKGRSFSKILTLKTELIVRESSLKTKN